jgi:BirA family biotin operon repressor/biotin-[acetyl-CoA-carboxylase] ligase
VTGSPVVRHRDHFPVVASTNDIVREWLASGLPEVCLAVADEQSAGRGREGRTWLAPAGAGLLVSLGFRPTWLPADQAWRLAATVALAMADAAEAESGLRDGSIRLKWPNDLVVEDGDRGRSGIRKIGGVLGESSGLGTDDPRVVVGIGINADWAAADFPRDLARTMTSLREATGGRPIDRDAVLDGFVDRLEVRLEGLQHGRFGVGDWVVRQVTTGREVRLEVPGGGTTTVRAVGVDASSGALLVEDSAAPGVERRVFVGEIRHLRLMEAGSAGSATQTGVTN